MEFRRNPTHLSPLRRELLSWFNDNAPTLAGAYEGALKLLADVSFPARIHFIAHAVRDIANILVYVLDPQLKGGQVQYKNALDQIQKAWPDIQGLSANESEPNPGQVAIDYRLASEIDKLIRDHRSRQNQPSNYELLFRYLMRNEPSKATVNQRLVDEFKNIHKWFMEKTHLRKNGSLDINEDELQRQFYRFEAMLHSFVGKFFTGSAKLDDILRQANQRTD